jgi:antitoxin HigA-1
MEDTSGDHPGEILVDMFMEPEGYSVESLAAKLQVPTSEIERIVHGECGITPDMATLLGQAFGTTAELWLRLQRNYEEAVAKRRF